MMRENKKDNNVVVSVVVPAYNAEHTLRRCLDSIINQTYRFLDIVIVDDGSSDATFSLMKDYARQDKRIKAVHSKHSGPNIARAIGVDKAIGKYIIFIDSDDFIANNTVSVLVDSFKKYDVDVVRFDGIHQKSGKVISPVSNFSNNTVINHDEVIELLLTTYKLNSLCLQAYKAKKIKKTNIFSSSLCFGEDFLANLRIHKNTNNMLVIHNPLYYYCFNNKSTTRTDEYNVRLKNISDRILASREAIDFVKKYSEDFREKVIYNQARMIKGSILGIAKVNKCNKNSFINDLSKILTKDTFAGIDIDKLDNYMKTLSWLEKIKNRRIISAVIKLDYDFIWKYIKMYKKVARFCV